MTDIRITGDTSALDRVLGAAPTAGAVAGSYAISEATLNRVTRLAALLGRPMDQGAPSLDLGQGAEAALILEEALAQLDAPKDPAPSPNRAMMAARVSVQLAAGEDSRPTPSGRSIRDVTQVSRHRAHTHFYALDEIELTHKTFAGGQSDPLQRSVLLAARAVILLPYDPKRDRVLLIEQFRIGPYARNDPHPWMIEAVAGMIDAGEAAETAAIREAEEEAGISVKALVPVADVYPTPGTATEFHKHFIAIADLEDGIEGIGGLEAESEDIQSYLLSAEDLFAARRDGQLRNAPLVLLALWLELNRDRLRSEF